MNYTVNLEDFVCMFLVVMYLFPDVKPPKRVCTFHTKICDLIQNYVHHGENQPRQEVEDGYIFVNVFVEKYDYLANNFLL